MRIRNGVEGNGNDDDRESPGSCKGPIARLIGMHRPFRSNKPLNQTPTPRKEILIPV